jgi:hypothetical protein
VNHTVPGPRAAFLFNLGNRGCPHWPLLVLLIVLHPGELASQTPGEQTPIKPLRIDITPLFGYRTSMTFPIEQNGQQTSSNVIFDARPSYGIAVGGRLNEEDLIEFRWARQDSHVHTEGSVPSASEKVVLEQFQGDFTHEYILDDWPLWARPFVMGSVGATHIGNGTNSSFTRFSFGLGGGIKIYFNRHVGLRVQGEWLPILVNPEVGTFVCGGGCFVHLTGTVVSQGEFVAGPLFRF